LSNINCIYNFKRFDPDYKGAGLTRGNHLEEVVWNEFASDPARLAAVAEAIRKGASEASNEPKGIPATETQIDPDEEFQEGAVLTRLHKRREIPREMRKIKGTACAGTSILLWTLSLSRALRLFVASGLQMSTQCLAPVCTTSCEMWFSLSNSSWAAVSDTMSLTGEPLDDLWDDD
jgi:hypothetical protein